MQCVVKTLNCVNSSITRSKFVRLLISQGLSNAQIRDRTGEQSGFVRTVRQRSESGRHRPPPKPLPAQDRSELRKLALKLYVMREGVLP